MSCLEPVSLPLVSILMPTHNRPEFFRLALESALAQTYANIEILVSDNSDDENTAELMKRYAADTRIRYKRNRGFDSESNWLWPLGEARGEYFAYLFDDDLFAPEKIARMAAIFQEEEGIVLVTSRCMEIDAQGREICGKARCREGFAAGRVKGKQAIMAMVDGQANLVGEFTAALVPRRFRSFVEAVLRARTALPDVEVWVRILQEGDLYFFSEPLGFVRRHAGQRTTNPYVHIDGVFRWTWLIGQELRTADEAQKRFLLEKLGELLFYGFDTWQRVQHILTRENITEEGVEQRCCERDFFALVDAWAKELHALGKTELSFLPRFAGIADFWGSPRGKRCLLLLELDGAMDVSALRFLVQEASGDFDICFLGEGELQGRRFAQESGSSLLEGRPGENVFLCNTAVRLHPEAEIIVRVPASCRLQSGSLRELVSCFEHLQKEARYSVGCVIPLSGEFHPDSGRVIDIPSESAAVYTFANYDPAPLGACLLTRLFWLQLGGFCREEELRAYCTKHGYGIAVAKKAAAHWYAPGGKKGENHLEK